jgi:anhydro-N-acetylmuramic acid kinase
VSAIFLGLMSGTSIDSIDAALFDFSDDKARLLGARAFDWDSRLRERLLAAARGTLLTPTQFAELDADAGQAFADAAAALIEETGLPARAIQAIGSHGQTLAHIPLGARANSLQIGDPNRIAERTGITTVADFRRRDMAAGGQGAPLAPAFHNALLRSTREDRLVLNLGGIANVTLLPADPDGAVTGFDTGPANCLLDHWISVQRGLRYDADGAWAGTGRIHPALLASLRDDPYFARPPPKSTGTQYFSGAWLDSKLAACGRIPAPDVQATLLALTVTTVRDAIATHAAGVQQVLLCGGGAHNGRLTEQLADGPFRLDSTSTFGIPPDWVEAAAFAWMAQQTIEGRAGNLPGVTGARGPRVLGAIHPA